MIIQESRVSILYTGGTIGSVRSPDGYVPAKSVFHEKILNNPRFNDMDEWRNRVGQFKFT